MEKITPKIMQDALAAAAIKYYGEDTFIRQVKEAKLRGEITRVKEKRMLASIERLKNSPTIYDIYPQLNNV